MRLSDGRRRSKSATTRRSRAWGIGAAVALALVAACSSSDESSPAPTSIGTGASGGLGGTGGSGASAGNAGGSAGGEGGGEPDVCPPPGASFAIATVLGTVAEGAEVVVCGSLFGATGPNVVLFDDMEGGQAGALVADGTPRIGQWLGGRGLYEDADSRSGALSMLAADADVDGGVGLSTVFGVPDDGGMFGLAEFDELFMSWSIRDLGDFPGNDSSPTAFSSDSSAKDIWVMLGDRGDNYDYSCSTGECNGNDLVLATHTGQGSFKIDGNTTSTSWWLPSFWEFQQWNTMSTHLKITADDPYGSCTGTFEHVSPGVGYVRDDYDGPIYQPLDGLPPAWDRVKVAAWYRQAGDVQRIMDDLYLAIGPGAAARIEIANAPTMESATKLAVSTVDAWSDGRIDVTLRLGDLDPQIDDLYLYVVNADNERSAGFAIAR